MSSVTVGPLVDVLRSQVRHAPAAQRVGTVTGVAGLIIDSEGPNVGLGDICIAERQSIEGFATLPCTHRAGVASRPAVVGEVIVRVRWVRYC